MSRFVPGFLLVLTASPALAQPAPVSTVMAVAVEVQAGCSVAASPLLLTTQQGRRGQSSADITIACGPDEPFTVSLDHGSHADGGQRRAYDPVADRYVAYDIFRDPGRSRRWADGSDDVVSGMTNALGKASLQAYGATPAHQDLRTGRYVDQVVVTVSF